MDAQTKEFFRKQAQIPENQSCADHNTPNPQWASINHGIYISLESSGVHRSLGVHISFVRSTTMDSWKPLQLKQMELGGNKRFKEFLKQHGVPEDMPIAEKYNTKAADWYRKALRAEAEGKELPALLPAGTGKESISDTPSTTQIAFAKAASSGAMMSAGGAFSADMKQYTGAVPTGGGGYAGGNMSGFGSDGPGTKMEDNSFFDEYLGEGVGGAVKDGVWGSLNIAKTVARRTSDFAKNKITEAQELGLVESVSDLTKKGAGLAMDVAGKTVEVAGKTAEKTIEVAGGAVDATRQTAGYLHEGTKDGSLAGRTTEVLGSAGNKAVEGVGQAMGWIRGAFSGGEETMADGLKGLSTGKMEGVGGVSSDGNGTAAGNRAAEGLQRMSTGKMQGFGSGGGADDNGTAAGNRAAEGLQRMSTGQMQGFGSGGPDAPSYQAAPATAAPMPTGNSLGKAPSPTEPKKKEKDVWDDDDWGDWG